jgi:uncharacterized protein (TIGR02099 family)
MLKFSTLSKLINLALRSAAWAMLGLGIVLAVAWATLHFWIVPRIEDFRPKLENLASQTIGVPVQMGRLVAVSSGWMPTFEIHDLALLDPEGRRALILPKVIFAISVRSVLDLGVEQLVIDSPTLDIRRTSTGEWRIAGLSLNKDESADSAAADWIFAQKEIVIQHGTVTWNDDFNPMSREKTSLNLEDVSWVVRNTARHHQWRLDATPPAGWGERFILMGDLKRGLLSTHPGRVKDWYGQVHVEFPDVDLSKLGPHLPWKVNATQGQGALRLWVDLSHGKVTQATADLVLENAKAQLSPELQALSFNNIAGRVSYKPSRKGFEFSTESLRFDTTEGLHWPGGNLSLSYTEADAGQNAKGIFHGDKLDLLALRNIALQLPLPEATRSTLLAHKVSGLVNSLHLEWTEPTSAQGKTYQVTTANGRFDGLSFEGGQAGSAHESWPGVENATISFDMNAEGGQVKASIEKGAIHINRVFEEPLIPIHKLQASMKWQIQNGSVSVPDWQLSLSAPDIAGEWRGNWKPSPVLNSPGVLDLQGTLSRGDAARVHRYLPLSLPQNVRHYVRDAIIKGEVQNVSVKIKGDLSQIPFANPKEGEFRFAGKVKDVQYAYVPTNTNTNVNTNSTATRSVNPEPTWPMMNNVNGDVVFDRLSFKVTGASGKWGSIPFTQIKAEIPHLNGKVVVNVQGDSKAAAPLVFNELRTSPVNPLLSGVLTHANGTGVLSTKLKLSLPLAELDKTSLQGSVTLAGNDIRLQTSLPLFEKAQGVINFNETGFSLVGVNAQFLGGPIKLDGGTRKLAPKSSEPNPFIKIQGQVSAAGLRQAKEIPLLSLLAQHANGTTPYTASLGFKGGQSELSIQSQLQGMALTLPAPLHKRSDELLAFKFDTTVVSMVNNKAQRDQMQLTWGRALSASYLRDVSTPEPRILNGRWTVGDAPAIHPVSLNDSGVVAVFNLTTFSVDEWLQVLSPPKSSTSYNAPNNTGLSQSAQNYLPTRMTLKASELAIQGRALHNVTVSGSRDGLLWRTNLDAKEFSGYLEYRQSTPQNAGRIYARLARLSLPPSAEQTVESLLEDSPVAIPALDIVVEDLELRGKKMGRVEIEAINTDPTLPRVGGGREWRLQKLNVTLPEASFKATGKWVTAREGGQAITDMAFKLDVSDSGELLNRLGTKDALRGGGGKLEGQVSWQGSPLSLHYPSLDGRFNVNIGRGQFLQAEPGVAKLLGVLSLQALPRRLLLDFRDVFSAGFAFDTIRGDVSIQQGIASTRNLQMKGVNAVVQMEGSSDIAKETQNLRVLILPEVDAGTASLLAGIALNPAIGLSTFLAQLVLKQPLSRVNTQEFVIDGTWSDPKVTKVTTNSN